MSRFEMVAGSPLARVTFDADELNVIRIACASASEKARGRMDEAADEGLEQAARQAEQAAASEMTDRLVALFKAGQEILVAREDLEPVLERLEAYGPGAPDEHGAALRRAIDRIERCFGQRG